MQGHVSLVNVHEDFDRKQTDMTLVSNRCHCNDSVPEATKFMLEHGKGTSDVKFRNRLQDLPSGVGISKPKGRPMNIKNVPKDVDAISE